MPLRDQAVGRKLSAVCTGLEEELSFIWSPVTDGAPAKITDLYRFFYTATERKKADNLSLLPELVCKPECVGIHAKVQSDT